MIGCGGGCRSKVRHSTEGNDSFRKDIRKLGKDPSENNLETARIKGIFAQHTVMWKHVAVRYIGALGHAIDNPP